MAYVLFYLKNFICFLHKLEAQDLPIFIYWIDQSIYLSMHSSIQPPSINLSSFLFSFWLYFCDFSLFLFLQTSTLTCSWFRAQSLKLTNAATQHRERIQKPQYRDQNFLIWKQHSEEQLNYFIFLWEEEYILYSASKVSEMEEGSKSKPLVGTWCFRAMMCTLLTTSECLLNWI